MEITTHKNIHRDAPIGILGGMGPYTTIDLLRKIRISSNASSDQEHVPVIIHCDPHVPDRSKAILTCNTAEVLDYLVRGLRVLSKAGVQAIALPCNTAHYWLPQMQRQVSVPIIDMISTTVESLAKRVAQNSRIGVLSTSGTQRCNLYKRPLKVRGLVPLTDIDINAQQYLDRIICDLKAGNLDLAHECLIVSIDRLKRQGADAVILGCTELSILWPFDQNELKHRPIIMDPTQELATECLRVLSEAKQA